MKALDAALDYSKQQIAFAGILVSVNLAFFPQHFDRLYPWASILTKLAWVSLILSIVFGLLLLGRAADQLAGQSAEQPNLKTNLKELRVLGSVQFLLLMFGAFSLVFVVFDGYK